jgi:hypothetical protein
MTNRIVLEFSQSPDPKDVALLIALAAKFNAVAVELPGALSSKKTGQNEGKSVRPEGQNPYKTFKAVTPALNLGFEKFPQNLAVYAVKQEQLDALVLLFEDEAGAETLSKLLTS